VGWRGRHWVTEGGRPTAWAGAPAIIPPEDPTVALNMTADIQWMSFDLMRAVWAQLDNNGAITPERWRILHGYGIAMNNGRQNGFNDTEPHADYVTLYPKVRDASYSLPRYDKMQRTFQGSFITGQLDGNFIYCSPGIDAIDANGFSYKPGTPEAAVTLKKIIDNAWYSVAIGTGDPPYHFRSQWGKGWIVYPFILDRTVRFDASYFARWDEAYLPEPLKTYTPA
jgi:hypothetical protein